MHIVFALADSQLETINTLFSSVFVDMIRCMEEEWDTLVDDRRATGLGTSHVLENSP